MEEGRPSRTAWQAACYRAVHQVLDGGRVFADPYAARVIGRQLDDTVAYAQAHPERGGMRAFVATRSRVSADALHDFMTATPGAASGVQVVVLGAGLDTTAWRLADGAGPGTMARIYSVDHPDTQAWARQVFAACGLVDPPGLVRVPVDFEREPLVDRLVAAGLDPTRPVFVSWLGVVPYLTEPSIAATLAELGKLAPGTALVLDYGDPPEAREPARRASLAVRQRGVARLGEPWLSFFTPTMMDAELRQAGFADVVDRGPADLAAYWLPKGAAPTRTAGGHVVHATLPAPRQALRARA